MPRDVGQRFTKGQVFTEDIIVVQISHQRIPYNQQVVGLYWRVSQLVLNCQKGNRLAQPVSNRPTLSDLFPFTWELVLAQFSVLYQKEPNICTWTMCSALNLITVTLTDTAS